MAKFLKREKKGIAEKRTGFIPHPLSKKRSLLKGAGFTLLELTLTAVILTGVLVALLGVAIYCFNLAETDYNTGIAYHSAREQAEAVFSAVGSITAGNTTFIPANFEGIGRLEITEVSPDVFQVRAVVCWRQRGRRIIGEDVNLNGALDGGEDSNDDGVLNSPCELITLMTKT